MSNQADLHAGDRRKTVVITQSNYLPWRGYFDMLRCAEDVILLDSVQYTRRDWRNRNQIKTPNGLAWLTVPVEVKGRYHQPIDETRVSDTGWSETHRRAIALAYRRAPHYAAIASWLDPLLANLARESFLSAINEALLSAIRDHLGLRFSLFRCSDLLDRAEMQAMNPTERLVKLALARNATHYLSGPAAQSYLDASAFTDAGMQVEWMSYAGYPEYTQLWGPFEPRVSIIDLLFNTGAEAAGYLDRQRQD